MYRRTLNEPGAAGLGPFTVPLFLQRAFADAPLHAGDEPDEILLAAAASGDGEPDEESDTGPGPLERALARARARGKPLLVFVVPRRREDVWPRGVLFAQTLTHPDPALRASLARCELACLRARDIPGSFASRHDPLMMLFATDGPTRCESLDADLPPLASAWDWAAPDDARDGTADRDVLVANARRRYEESVDRRVAGLAELIHLALESDPVVSRNHPSRFPSSAHEGGGPRRRAPGTRSASAP